MEKTEQSIRCLSLPLENTDLLVPGSVVAEVIPYLSHTPIDQDTPWMLGRIPWRGLALPLVSFEVAANLSKRPAIGRRVAVFNTIGGNPALPFYALFIQAVPRLIQLDRHNLKEIHGDTGSPLLRSLAEYAGNRIAIPELERLERQVLSAWSQIYERQDDTAHS
jgi:chemosensory pili system protein ChpC